MNANECSISAEPEPYGDNFVPVIMGQYPEHTPDTPFCWDTYCPCHEDQDAIAAVDQAYQNGLLTAEDATRIVQGHTI